MTMFFGGRRRDGSCNSNNNSNSTTSQQQRQASVSRFTYPGQRASAVTTTTTRYNADGSQVSRCTSTRTISTQRTASLSTISTTPSTATTPSTGTTSSSYSATAPAPPVHQQHHQQQRVVVQGSYTQSCEPSSSPFPDLLGGSSSNTTTTNRTTSSSSSSMSSAPVPTPFPAPQPQQAPQPHHQQQPQPQQQQHRQIIQQQQHNTQHVTEPTVRPGAYAVTRSSSGPSQVFRVTVPQGVRPGTEFSVHAGSRRVRVRCPPTTCPGQVVQITLPPEPITSQTLLRSAPLTSSESNNNPAAATNGGGGGAVPMTDDVMRVNQIASETGTTAETFLVTIPENIYPGMTFTANVDGQRFMVTCPPNAGPGMTVRIVPPQRSIEETPEALPRTQVFEVVVPTGVRPNQPFTLMANGQRVLVTCPPNVSPGQKIRFQLPIQQAAAGVKLSYEGCGWSRTVRVSDMKFQWVRLDNHCHNNHNTKMPTTPFGNGGKTDHSTEQQNPAEILGEGPEEDKADLVDMENKFDFKKSAYVRKLQFLEGNDARMRTGTLKLVPASEAVVDSRLIIQNKVLMSYADIASIQGKALEDKSKWLQSICKELKGDWNTDGHIKICIRRRHLLDDSINSVMSLSRNDLRKYWRIEFIGEPGIDAGGITRDFFQQVTEQIFDPNKGLWKPSIQNQMCMTINSASYISCPDDHLIYFRFLGRIIGRALFDKQLISSHLVRHIYKHLLGWPITFSDLEHQDEDYYKNLKKLLTYDNISDMCMDFTVTEETLGVRTDVNLVDDGNERSVTNDNIDEYLEANLRYRMLNREKTQLTELLLGFFDVIPEPVLSVFDHQELELLLCGLPEIDVEDWKSNTNYTGLYLSKGRRHNVVEWFWDVVTNKFDQEMKARLLQFVTGTSGVPPAGFSVLQGNDGNIKKFTVHGVATCISVYPRAHTCFNRIDLPCYTSKDELEEKLRAAITMSAQTGFDME